MQQGIHSFIHPAVAVGSFTIFSIFINCPIKKNSLSSSCISFAPADVNHQQIGFLIRFFHTCLQAFFVQCHMAWEIIIVLCFSEHLVPLPAKNLGLANNNCSMKKQISSHEDFALPCLNGSIS
uniref:Uncharacterized protein n=1 Tax=Cacopsylla melanoneura TaxID=428564 RepID=A0A8D9E739_9HEMI